MPFRVDELANIEWGQLRIQISLHQYPPRLQEAQNLHPQRDLQTPCRGAPNTIPQTVSADKPPALPGAPAPRRLMVVFGDRQPVAAAPTLICHGAQKQGSSPRGRASSHQGQGARRPKRPLSRGASVPTHGKENAPLRFALAPSGPGHSRLYQKRR